MQCVITGQILLILCCIVYMVWWYRGFRPGTTINRVRGVNGVLLLFTAGLGISGIVCSLLPISGETAGDISPKINNMHIIVAGIATYVILLLVTRVIFNRVVTTELMLIVGWTMLEISVINRLNASGILSDSQVVAMSVVIVAAFIISMVLYVAYYRMEDMKAFYAAMVPLVTEAITMGALLVMALH